MKSTPIAKKLNNLITSSTPLHIQFEVNSHIIHNEKIKTSPLVNCFAVCSIYYCYTSE